MHSQSEKLKKTGRNLKKIEKNTLPGIDKLVGMIRTVELRNKIIIAFVIALCIAIWIYLQFMSGSSSLIVPTENEGMNDDQTRSNITKSMN